MPSCTLLPLSQETPIAQSWYSSTMANRINTWTYDNVGNVLNIPMGTGSRSFAYDAENRQVSATIGSATTTYTYDGLGQRVSKSSGGQTTTYVYDAFGNLAAEYGPAEASPCGTSTCYLTWDHLGSPRMLTDANGVAQRRYDYLPFGQEILAGIDGRSTPMGYLALLDDTNPKFTGQMRDKETTLDWFNVRHMSGAQGRFQSPDPGNAGANLGDPQTWNAYAYVGNNPLSITDPSGMNWFTDAFSWAWDVFKDALKFFGLHIVPAVLGNVVGIPYLGEGGLAGIGGVTGCGGPLGNCGTLGSDPWSENSGLNSVSDPGRFISDFSEITSVDTLTYFSNGFGPNVFAYPTGKFKTLDCGGSKAVNSVQGVTKRDGLEYGGYVYRNQDGTYSYSAPIQGTPTSIPRFYSAIQHPTGLTIAGWFHTHPLVPGYASERFSGNDLSVSRNLHGPGYLGTPSGAVLKLAPVGRGVTTRVGTGVCRGN